MHRILLYFVELSKLRRYGKKVIMAAMKAKF